MYLNGSNIIYFDGFGVEHNNIRTFIGKKNVTRNIYRIQAYYSIMWGYFCMLKGKSFFDYRNLFYPNDYEKNDKKY